MKETEELIDLLKLNLQIVSQVPSVLCRTNDALKIAIKVNNKIKVIEQLIESQKYANDVLTVNHIKIILEA